MLLNNISNETFRILYLPSPPDNQGFWISLSSESNIPKAFAISETSELLNMGILEPVADTQVVVSDENLNTNSVIRRDRTWNLIKNIVQREPDIYMYSRRAELLKIVETQSGVQARNLYNYLGKYWRSGFQINALAPNYKNCGGAREATGLDNRVGKRKREGENGKVLNEQDYKNFQYAIQHYYQNGKGMTLHQTYRHMLSKHYVVPRFENDPEPTTMSADEKPSFSQFYYWHHKNRDVVKDTFSREGERKFNLNHRAIPGRTETLLFGPGDSFQVDATIGDFYLVQKSDRSKVVGRPIVVFYKDAWSRIITGMNITLENSSFPVWKSGLINVITSKVDYCTQFGLEIKEEDWPCHVLPSSITTDNGEFAVKAINDIVSSLGITVENCPSFRGDLKGIIERTFKTFNLTLRPYIPGHVDKDAGERGAKDYRLASCLDLETFTAIMIKVVLFYNNNHYLKDYQRTDDMREKNIPAIPLHLWNYGIAHRSGALQSVAPEKYVEALLQKGEAAITAKGIRWQGLYYICDAAVDGKWLERARIEGSSNVSIRYNPLSCKTIYIKGSDGKFLTCSLTDAYAANRNATEEEIKAAHQTDLDNMASFTQQEDQAYSNMVHFMEANVTRCNNEKESGTTIAQSLKKHSVIENRQEEINRLSGKDMVRDNQETACKSTGSVGKPSAYDSISDDIDAIMSELKPLT